jgi:hypothetical protein
LPEAIPPKEEETDDDAALEGKKGSELRMNKHICRHTTTSFQPQRLEAPCALLLMTIAVRIETIWIHCKS